MKRAALLAFAALCTLCVARPAQATVLLVGASNAPPDVFLTNPVTDGLGTVIAHQVVNGSASTLNVTVNEYVVRETATGTLDFVYQVKNNAASSDAVGRVTVSNFGSGPRLTTGPFILDVGYVAGTGTIGVNTQPDPDTVDRLNAQQGRVVGFNFTILGVEAGANSAVLVVATNAKSYTTGAVAVIDGSSVNLAGYQPLPEPSTMAMAGLGALGLIGYGLRRRKAKGA
jgi:hypothetical protein